MSLQRKRPVATRKDILGVALAALVGLGAGVLTRNVTWGAVTFLVTVITVRTLMLGIKPKKD